MPRPNSPARKRIGQVSFYEHHGAHWVYHRQNGKPCREHVGASAAVAECIASLLNAQLVAAAAGVPLDSIVAQRLGGLHPSTTPPTGQPAQAAEPLPAVAELRRKFLAHHEKVLESSLNTVSRYSTATLHLENFAAQEPHGDAGDIGVSRFIEHLRALEISPNGHANTARRKLRDKGILYILEVCRSMYHFGIRHGIFPRGFTNPFTTAGLGRVRIRDAKPIFVFSPEQELAFLKAAKPWAFGIHFLLAKTGLRAGELVHLLIEDLDLDGGWLHVRGKPELGWVTKTNRERRVPLAPEVVKSLRHVTGNRREGVVFLRPRLAAGQPVVLPGDREKLAQAAQQRLDNARNEAAEPLTRREEAKVFASIWQDAGAVPADHIRTSFLQTARKAGLNATCPKSWRHTFATLLQEANVDLLVRQETLGHKPTSPGSSALGMTGVYTHTTPEFQRREIDRALRLRPRCLELAETHSQGKPT